MNNLILSAPSSTKNKEKKRDPDAHQVKKGNTWYFGYKAHIGLGKDSGLVHTVEATAANVHDVSQTASLLTGEEEAVVRKKPFMVIVVILAPQSVKTQSFETNLAGKSSTRSIAARLR